MPYAPDHWPPLLEPDSAVEARRRAAIDAEEAEEAEHQIAVDAVAKALRVERAKQRAAAPAPSPPSPPPPAARPAARPLRMRRGGRW